MTHPFARTLEQPFGIRQVCAKEKADVHMSPEDVDVAKGHIPETHNGTAIVHQLQHFVTAGAELREPLACDRTELAGLLLQPGVDSGIVFQGSLESKDFFHENSEPIGVSQQYCPPGQEGGPSDLKQYCEATTQRGGW